MIFSNTSKQAPLSQQVCSECGETMTASSYAKYPVITQTVFGISFFLFLFFSTRLAPKLMYFWTALQVFLAILLIRGRLKAKKTVYRCVRCEPLLK